MICAPVTGCVNASCCSSTSAGGQLSQPSDVNSSTTIGVGGAAAGCTATARANARTARVFRAIVGPVTGSPNHQTPRLPDCPAAPDDPPDDEHEQDGNGDEHRAEQIQRAIENRLGLHARLDRNLDAFQAIGERLLPDEDVAPAKLAVLLVKGDLARQMQTECDDLE